MQQTSTSAPADPVVHHWDQSPSSVPAARNRLRDTLRNWDLADLADDSALVLSELLSNAVEHSRNSDRKVSTRFSRLPAGRGVRIEVFDADTSRLPHMPSEAGTEDVRGRGLRLVDACTAQRWGIVLGASGKAVWGEVAR